MNYKEKYERALNRAKKLYEQGTITESLGYVFPELKESEGERIRKAIIRILKGETGYTSKEDTDKYVAWLEKQGEKKNTRKREIDDAYLQGICDAKYEIEKQGEGDKEKYEQALKKDLDLYNQGLINPPLEHIFPELKKSEDERMRKEIIDFLRLPHPQFVGKRDHEKWSAWLEKQGEKVTNINGEDYGIDGLYHAIKILEKTIGRVTGYQSDDGILEHKAAINAVKELYEKQYAQKHFSDFNANDWYVSKVDGKIHDMTYNPTDKVEPKFRVGDFIANDYCSGKVIEITNDAYLLDTGQGIPFSCEHNAHLWTIKDAKDGDVLVILPEKGSEQIEQIFLFKAINSRDYVDNCIEYYCRLCDGAFYKNKTGYMGTTLDTFYPATKEQRDLLFQAMKEAGYKWDSKKKELKKIEVKALDANEDFGL